MLEVASEKLRDDTPCVRYSIIVPVYNNASGMNSIVDWFDRNDFFSKSVELIIVDDGSSDPVKPKGCSGVGYYYQDNTGVSGARNLGIEKARGEYLCFLDSDDAYHDNFVDVFDEALASGSFDMLVSAPCYVQASERNIRSHSASAGRYRSNDFLQAYFSKRISAHVCSILLRRRFLLEQGLRFDRELYLSEDIFFIVLCATKASNLVLEEQSYFDYYLVEGSATNRIATEKVLNHFKSFVAISDLDSDSSLRRSKNYFVATMYVHFLLKLISNKTESSEVISSTVAMNKLLRQPMVFPISTRGLVLFLFRIVSYLPSRLWLFFLTRFCRP
ncbi:glycosyltransferase family 2 protein [Agaribacterium sp. ZY112]|uniref:glycosyltransferase family 2 protein n=1 Tax=Agaribacterium sp. ZY112 TaxID=3233574 RepID=UPI003526014B